MASQTWKVVGPPGTGKTTYVCDQVARATERLTSGRGVLLSSLTKAAAVELKDRVQKRLPHVNGELHVGTLHSHAFHALRCPDVFGEKNGSVDAWNDEMGNRRPEWRITSSSTGDEDTRRNAGDKVLQDYGKRRAKLTDRELWPTHLLKFAEAFESFKRAHDLVDFYDMIDNAYYGVDNHPSVPQFIFIDEAQDHDRAQFRLILKWAARPEVEHLVVVGDPKQNLYQWRGSEPEAFNDLVSDDHKIVLSQSYRVPKAVWEVARSISTRITDCPDDVYQPREGDAGEVHFDCVPFTDRGYAGEVAMEAIERHEGESVMFLATCSYMLRPLITALKDAGVPFWNPYKLENGSFNPLSRRSGTSASNRILDFMGINRRGAWTYREMASWLDVCKTTDFLKRGIKKQITDTAKQRPESRIGMDDLYMWFHNPQEVIGELQEHPFAWLGRHLKDGKLAHYSYLFRVVEKFGEAGITEEPKIVVGTIHSVKGGEADAVYLATDLSPQEREGAYHNSNALHRKFYVGATRTRSKLYVCAPGISRYGAYDI